MQGLARLYSGRSLARLPFPFRSAHPPWSFFPLVHNTPFPSPPPMDPSLLHPLRIRARAKSVWNSAALIKAYTLAMPSFSSSPLAQPAFLKFEISWHLSTNFIGSGWFQGSSRTETLCRLLYISYISLDFYSERIDFEDSVLFLDKYFVTWSKRNFVIYYIYISYVFGFLFRNRFLHTYSLLG